MRLILLLVTVMALGSTVGAQEPAVAAGAGNPSSVQGGGAADASLERIREGLAKPLDQTLLHSLDAPPDFTMRIEEQAHIDQIMQKLDFKSGPAPAGGLYGFEQQQRLFNPTSRPLQQPYAAFSGGELITIAIENLMGRYLGRRVLDSMSAAERSHAEGEARKEVDQAVAEYCAQRPDRYDIQICISPPLR